MLEFYSTNSLSWDNLEYKPGGVFNLHYGLIHHGLPSQINLTENELPSIKEQFLPIKNESCKEGDVIFADASEDINDIGKAIEFFNCDGKIAMAGLHTIHGRDRLDQTIVGFKVYAFSAKAFKNQIRMLAQGTKVYSISTKNFHDCFIAIPEKEEQYKIVKTLNAFSKAITVEKKRLDAFLAQKDFLIRKMFI